MASKRGLSSEEKRKRMLDFFFEKQDFFQLKEIERLCSTEKGITLNTVKDILQSLVDDGLVNSEKIGTSVYFWSFPSQLINKRQETIKQIEEEIKNEEQRNETLKNKLATIKIDEKEAEKRDALVAEYEKANEEKKKLIEQLKAYSDNDPDVIDKMKSETEKAKTACNKWIDNIFTLKSYLKSKYKFEEKMINKQFEIPSDLDYIQ